jgi:hypothetical protein
VPPMTSVAVLPGVSWTTGRAGGCGTGMGMGTEGCTSEAGEASVFTGAAEVV